MRCDMTDITRHMPSVHLALITRHV